MRIVYIFNSLAHKGGTERIFTDKMNYLADVMGHEVTFISYDQGNHDDSYPLSAKVRHIDLDTRFFTLSAVSIWKRIFCSVRMRKLFFQRLGAVLAGIRPDIVIIPTYLYPLLSGVMQLPYPVIVEAHVCYDGILNMIEESHSRMMGNIVKSYARYCLRKAKKANRVVLLTENARQQWKGFDNLEVIPNVLTHYPSAIADVRQRRHRIISVGRLDIQKGYDLLVEAWAQVSHRHPDWTLDIYGEGDERRRLQTMIDDRQLQQSMHLKGVSDDIYSKYQDAAFYVMSSRYEGWGLVLVEGMACGLPCVSFDCLYGPSDIITDGEDGYLVENGNVSQLAEKMEALINDETLREDMALHARRNAARFCKENIMHRWETLFENIVGHR